MRITLIVLLLALLGGWLYLRHRKAREIAAELQAAKADQRIAGQKDDYHAVSIRFAVRACAAAKELEGHRFLATAAPRLPLPGCDSSHCDCRFQHFSDRRSGQDRRSPFASDGFAAATGKFEIERRQGIDRRSSVG